MNHPGDNIKIRSEDKDKSNSFYSIEKTEELTDYDRALIDYFIMKKMRERFGEKSYNAEHLFPDPRKQWPPKNPKRLKRTLSKRLTR